MNRSNPGFISWFFCSLRSESVMISESCIQPTVCNDVNSIYDPTNLDLSESTTMMETYSSPETIVESMPEQHQTPLDNAASAQSEESMVVSIAQVKTSRVLIRFFHRDNCFDFCTQETPSLTRKVTQDCILCFQSIDTDLYEAHVQECLAKLGDVDADHSPTVSKRSKDACYRW